MALSNVTGRGKGGGFQVVCKYLVILQQVKMQEINSMETKARAETGNHLLERALTFCLYRI